MFPLSFLPLLPVSHTGIPFFSPLLLWQAVKCLAECVFKGLILWYIKVSLMFRNKQVQHTMNTCCNNTVSFSPPQKMTEEYCVHEAGFVLILFKLIRVNCVLPCITLHYSALHMTCSTSDKRQRIREMIKHVNVKLKYDCNFCRKKWTYILLNKMMKMTHFKWNIQ